MRSRVSRSLSGTRHYRCSRKPVRLAEEKAERNGQFRFPRFFRVSSLPVPALFSYGDTFGSRFFPLPLSELEFQCSFHCRMTRTFHRGTSTSRSSVRAKREAAMRFTSRLAFTLYLLYRLIYRLVSTAETRRCRYKVSSGAYRVA